MNRAFHPPYKPRLASPKDYDHAKTFGAAPLALPRELLNITPILNQGNEPSCTAYASAAARRAMTGTEYDPELQWQLELQYKGVTKADGFPMDVPAEVGKKVGFIPKGKALPQDKVGGYFWVTKTNYDWFDTIRTTQYQLYQRTGKVIPFQFGINWYAEWDNTPNGIIPDSQIALLGGHDTLIAGFQTYSVDGNFYLVNQGSWGTEYGDQGLFRFSRAQANKNIGKFGIFYWLDAADMPEEVARLKIYAAILQNIKAIYQLIVNSLHTNGTYPPPTPPVAPAPHVIRIEDWARAIQVQEGWSPTSVSFAHNNPGNLKYSTLTASWGAIQGHNATDGGAFCQFRSYAEGFKALCNFLTLGAENELLAFHRARTLRLFTKVYAQPPNDNYSINVAKALKVDVDTDISTFI